jgi:hypothetical protein
MLAFEAQSVRNAAFYCPGNEFFESFIASVLQAIDGFALFDLAAL